MTRTLASRIGLGLLSLALLWVMIGSTASAVLARRSPAAAVTLWPWNGAALAERATEIVNDTGAGPGRIDEARALALRGLDATLLNPVAARSLGMAASAAGDHAGADRWFGLSNILSRRDLPSRLWLVQDSLIHNDLPGSVRHIDVALRTSSGGARTLIPLLVNIAAYPQVAGPLGKRLALRPVWWGEFITALEAEQPANRSLGQLVAALHLDVTDERERAFAQNALARLVLSHDFAQAQALYHALLPAAPQGVLRDGGFDDALQLPPFAWMPHDESRIQRNRRPDGGSNALYLLPGAPGIYVQQIQMLAAGRYRAGFTAGVENGRQLTTPPAVSIFCLAATERRIASVPLPQQTDEQGAGGSLTFDIPAADCPAQWVMLEQTEPSSVSGPAAWIDDIRLERVAG